MTPAVEFFSQSHREHRQAQPKPERPTPESPFVSCGITLSDGGLGLLIVLGEWWYYQRQIRA